MRRGLGLACATATSVLACGPSGAVATSRDADLVVKSVRASARTAEPTAVIRLSTVVANVGPKRSGASDVEYVLARGRRPVAKDRRLAAQHRVGALRPGARRKARGIMAIVPPGANGRYRLFACVRVRPPAKERVKGNNCRAGGSLRVTAPTPPGRVTPVRAEDRAAAAMIGPAGGKVEATAPDGSVVRLVLPKDALTSRVLVRLVPLLRLDGAGIGGASLVAGAEIEPAGILLEAVGRLEVVPAGGGAPALAAAYDPGGAQLHLVPAGRAPFAALVTRFVGYAMFAAPSPGAAARGLRSPPDPGYRIEHAIARLQAGGTRRRAAARAAQEGVPSAPEARLLAAAYYVDVVRPELITLSQATSSLDPEAAIAAMGRLTQALRQLELLGIDDPLPDAYAAEASRLMQAIVRNVFDERIRRCHRGEVRSAVGMIGFLFRSGGGSGGAPVGIGSHAKSVDEVLGAGWMSRAAVCLRLKFRFDVSTANEWRQGNEFEPEISVADVGWHDATSEVMAELDGYSGSVGSPHDSLIQGWQQGIPLRWLGKQDMTVDGVVALERPHPPPEPNTCNPPTDAATLSYRNPQGQLTVEIVPLLETFDTRVQAVDTSGKLQVRFAEEGGIEQVYHCDVTGDERVVGTEPVFKAIHLQRGDGGMFQQRRADPSSIGAERWYTLPLQGGSQQLTEGGVISLTGLPSGSSWSTNGVFTVTAIPPG